MVGSLFPLQSFHFLYPEKIYIKFFRQKKILQRLCFVMSVVQIFY